MLVALVIGFILLMAYGILRGYRLKGLFKMAFSGVLAVRNIAIVMLLVGALTALWRACGTVAFIVSASSDILTPSVFLPIVFLLCAAISILTGTSIGTAATMGVICMSVGNALGINGALCGGAILAGAYYGDRCSPVSTSAMLVAEITKTSLYENIRTMIRTAWIPTFATLGIYAALGFIFGSWNANINIEAAGDISSLLQANYSLSFITLLPAIAILVLAAFRVNVKITMAISIAIAAILCIFIQGIAVTETLRIMFCGFNAPEPIKMMSGGGVFGMLKMIVIVTISLTYAGLFKGTGILDYLHKAMARLSQRVSPAGCTVVTSIVTCALSCNQTLTIVLTNEICNKIIPENKSRAIVLEDTAVVIAPLIPWSVASLIPLGATGAPTASILLASYLYLLPLASILRNRKKAS